MDKLHSLPRYLSLLCLKSKRLDVNSEQYDIEMKNISKNMVDFLSSESIDIIMFHLDLIYFNNQELIYYILQQNNEKIITSWIALEYMRGSYIQDNTIISSYPLFKNYSQSNEKTNADAKIKKILNDYLKRNSFDESYYFTDEWQQIFISLFTKYKNDFLDDKHIINLDNLLNYLLPSNLILDDKKSQILSSLLDKTNGFEVDYYSYYDLFTRIKGFYKLFPIEDQMYYLISPSYFRNKEDAVEKMFDMFHKIAEINSDDEKGLRAFFRRIEYCLSNDEYYYNLFKETDIFKKYLIQNYEVTCHETVKKLLNNDENIDESIIYCLGSSKDFIDNYDFFFNQFMNSKDEMFKRKLFIPLIVGLFEKLKVKYNLPKYRIYFSVPSFNEEGECNSREEILKIDFGTIDRFEDINDAFVALIGTVFHEMRHAYQEDYIKRRASVFDYNDIVYAIDRVLWYLDDNYYHDNYSSTSFEQDAVACEYAETMKLFENYPEIQKRISSITQQREYENRDFSQSFYIRAKRGLNGEINYYGIIDLFLKEVTGYFLSGEEKEARIRQSFERLKYYPILDDIFNIDYSNHTIELKNANDIFNMLELFRTSSSSLHEAHIIKYTIESLSHALRVGRYLSNPENDIKKINTVGIPPTVQRYEDELMGIRTK